MSSSRNRSLAARAGLFALALIGSLAVTTTSIEAQYPGPTGTPSATSTPPPGPTDPGVIPPGGLLCFTYAGPTTTLANFAAFFAAGVDGINIQQPNGSYKSWFRLLPSAATATVLVNGDRVCAGGTPGAKVFS